MVKAGVGARSLALFIDLASVGTLFSPITYAYSGKWVMTFSEHRAMVTPVFLAFLFTLFVIVFSYFIFMEALLGWTVGKWTMRLRVVDESGNRIGLLRSLIRNLLRLVDGLPFFSIFGIWLMLSSGVGQRFGDRIARTYVVPYVK
ncbi:MAG: RDD family protein [Chloroflexota bacterium]